MDRANEAGRLFKKLSKGKLSSEEASKATVRLNELEGLLTPEEQKVFEEKKQKVMAKVARKQANLKEKEGVEPKDKKHDKEKKLPMQLAFKLFQKLRKFVAKGKDAKIDKCTAKIINLIPEQNVQNFTSILNSVLIDFKGKDVNLATVEEQISKLEQMFLESAGTPEEKQKRIEEWKEAESLWRAKKEKKTSK